LAALLKFFPLLLVPFFCLDQRRFDRRAFVAAAGTVVTGLVIGLAIWGDGIRSALSFGIDRRPKLLSFLAAWSAHPELYGHWRVVQAMIRWNAILVAAVCVVVFAVAYLLRLSWIESATLALLSVLLTYKVGHPQFFVSLPVLFVGLLIAKTPRSLWLAYCCIPFALFLSIYELGFAFLTDTYSFHASIVRRDGGFYAFGLAIVTVVVFLAGLFSKPATLGTEKVDEAPLAVSS
jgi:hypothetical protein